MSDDVAHGYPDLPGWSSGVTEIPVAADPHRLTRRLVDRRYHRRGRPAIQIEQMLLEVDGDPMLARHDADPVQGRLGDLGGVRRTVEFGGLELPRRAATASPAHR